MERAVIASVTDTVTVDIILDRCSVFVTDNISFIILLGVCNIGAVVFEVFDSIVVTVDNVFGTSLQTLVAVGILTVVASVTDTVTV